MENQIVSSYVRYKKPKEKIEADMIVPTALIGIVIVALGIMLWQVSLAAGLVGAGYYASTKLNKTNIVTAAPIAVETKKRSYNKRLKVNHYALGKVSL